MATTKNEIRRWLEDGMEKGASHVVVLCDTFDWEDFPVLVYPGEDPTERVAAYRREHGDTFKVMECYDLGINIERQLDEFRARHWTPHPSPSSRA